MKKKYNELLQIQKAFFTKIHDNMQNINSKNPTPEELQKFVESNYGMTTEDLREIKRVRKKVDELIAQMKLNGINPTPEEMFNGFEEVN